MAAETLWDIGSVAYHAWNGNWGDVAMDALAMCLPGVPAGTFQALRGLAGQVAKSGDGTIDVYRAFGGDARAQGFSWTTKDPRKVDNFRDAAGLPSGGASGATNTADFLIEGKVNVSDVIRSRSALPLDGNKGGLPELIIDPKNVNITDFSVLKP